MSEDEEFDPNKPFINPPPGVTLGEIEGDEKESEANPRDPIHCAPSKFKRKKANRDNKEQE